MTEFTSETPLGQDVQALLLAHRTGLTMAELRRKLRTEKGRHVNEANLVELLRHTRTFTALSDGRYMLASHIPDRQVEGHRIEPVAGDAADPWGQPLIGNLPYARHGYVVFDVETTGTDPGEDRIIQIAALKILSGTPVAVRTWYVNPGAVTIPYTVQVKLGLADDPASLARIAAAPALNEVLPLLLTFVGTLPLVAYNARFDMRFLHAATGDSPPPNRAVDAQELAVLLLPHLTGHSLAGVAEALDVAVDSLSAEWSSMDLDSNVGDHRIAADTLHNAVTDVYLLHCVYRRLLELVDTRDAAHDLLRALLPEAFNPGAAYAGVDDAHLAPMRARCAWARPLVPAELHDTPTLPSADRYLIDHLSAKGCEPRPGQIEMQSLLADALNNDRYAMVEAPTGTGKTLSYLTAAVHHARSTGQRVVLSTAYRNLQDQLLSEIADLEQHGNVRFRSQVLKGIGNYLCWSQLARYLGEGDPRRGKASRILTLTERFVLAYIAIWLPVSNNGSADDVSFWIKETLPVARKVIDQLRAQGSCHPNLQTACAACPMPAAYANAQQADIVVINHALWLTDAQRLPSFTAVVLDEAHTLEDVATNALTQEVSSETLGNLLARLFDPRTERGVLARIRAGTDHSETLQAAAAAMGAVRRVHNLVDDFGPYLVQFIRRCTERVDPRYGAPYRLEARPWAIHGPPWQRVAEAHRQLFGLHLKDALDALSRLCAMLPSTADLPYGDATLRELGDLIDDLGTQRQLAHDLIKVADQTLVYWLSVGPPIDPESQERDAKPTWWAFKAAPLDVGAALQPLYDRLSSVALVSATLALRGNDFSYFIERLGLADRLERAYVRKLPPALPYDRRVFLALANYLTYAPLQQTMASFVEELAGELRLFLRFTDGRALGLFTARARMQAIADAITPALAASGIPLYVDAQGASRRRMMAAFKEHRSSVLFGLRSFWEGVDAPGETLSFVLMEKLPFPLLIEPVHRARAEYLVKQGKSEFDDYMLPLMLLQFKQGFGRLMRCEDDRGAVVLFDKRIHRKEYRADLLASLPGFLPRDEEAERSRRGLYEALAHTFPDLIDQESKRELLLGLPDEVLLHVEEVLRRYRLPATIPSGEYDRWRPVILAALKDLFGHDGFRTIGAMDAQERVIRHLLAGEDVLGILPTGAGKSLTFQLPALLRDGVTLVFSPLIALMKDQVAGLNERGIEVVGAIYSGQSSGERDDVLERMRRGRARLVYISPERLRDPLVVAALSHTRIVQVVVDEAHCVDMWGPSFRPDFLYLPRLFDHLGYRPPLAALTATATPAMQESIVAALTLRQPVRVVAPIDRPELQIIVYNARHRYSPIRSHNDRFKLLLRILAAADRTQPPILIYVATTVEADQLARHLRVAGHDARAYHGKMNSADRASVQEMFMDDHVNIVVCTKAFGMGIDKPDIRYVIHYNMPGDLESYFQEAGSAGRDGQTAYCILLYHKGDIATQEYFIDNSTPDEETINAVLHHLSSCPGQRLYLDPMEAQETLGLEDVQLRVALHQLEGQGYLVRLADFTLTGTMTFQVDPSEALAAWRADNNDEAPALEALLRHARWPAYRKIEVDIPALASGAGLTPDTVDRLLHRLLESGAAIYRPWRRGFVLDKTEAMRRGGSVAAGALAAEQHRSEMRRKLAQMTAYATDNAACRRAMLLRYFGLPPTVPCARCDTCQPGQEWPWSLMMDRDIGTLDAYLDPAFVILESIKWNQDRARRYGAPYGIGTLLAVLKGDQYAATRFEDDYRLKKWRLAQLRSCPHWGVLALIPARDRVLKAMLERLLAEGYVSQREYGEQDAHTYMSLALTSKGADQLTSGRLLQWTM